MSCTWQIMATVADSTHLPTLEGGRQCDKSFAAYKAFINDVKSGKNHIVLGEGYVVISHEEFKRLKRNSPSEQRHKDIICSDSECDYCVKKAACKLIAW